MNGSDGGHCDFWRNTLSTTKLLLPLTAILQTLPLENLKMLVVQMLGPLRATVHVRVPELVAVVVILLGGRNPGYNNKTQTKTKTRSGTSNNNNITQTTTKTKLEYGE